MSFNKPKWVTQQTEDEHTLSEVYRTVPIPSGASWFKRFLAFAGPGYLVSVGYMDPGNWATDLAGGSKYGYALLWVILMSNLFAMLLQTLCARLGLVTGMDLASACRARYKKPAAIALWLLAEVAIIATDLAEVIGSAVALNLLFGIPLVWGVLITGVDVLLLLGLMRYGFRKLEAVVVTLVATIAVCFALQIFWANPSWSGIAGGLFKPSLPGSDALFIALGILGATVMPHNLYLHSSIVQTRAHEPSPEGLKQAVRLSTLDTIIALAAAFFVNAAILIVAAAVFHKGGTVVEELKQAYELLTPLLGGAAATAFAVALLASGQSSTITGTLSGQIVMEGFLKIRIQPWLRRLITRSLAIIPALFMISATGGTKTVELLVLSQVILCMQLSFAVFPLVAFTSNKKLMGKFENPAWLKWLAYAIGVTIASLNAKLLYETLAKTIGLFWFYALIVVTLCFSAYVKWICPEKPEEPTREAIPSEEADLQKTSSL